MPEATFRFYAELNDFLPAQWRQRSFRHCFDSHASVKHIIESLGVPHTEVDLILINGSPVGFNYRVSDKDMVSVYPMFERLDITGASRLRAKPLRDPRFVLDTHLGKLAAYLRMLGFDALYRNDFCDEELAVISSQHKRTLLTRDRGLLKRNLVTHGAYIREESPIRQAVEVLKKFDLAGAIVPFTRCLICNERLVPVDKDAINHRLLPETSRFFCEFVMCPVCDRIYWKGSHYERMQKILDFIQKEAASG